MLLQLQDHGTSLWQLGRYAITLTGLFGRSGAGLRRGPVVSSPLRRRSVWAASSRRGLALHSVGSSPQSVQSAVPSTANFNAGADGRVGTLVTDPPASSSVVRTPLAVHH
jgi:hypothetical protein